MSPPDPGPIIAPDVNTSFSSSVAGSEQTVINVQESQGASGGGWTNTLDSNIGSGNSTPKFKRKETFDSGSSRFVTIVSVGVAVSNYSP